MDQLYWYLTTGFDLLLVMIGFSLIIVLHELGHFLAARWAGIRVLAFALGFGPAIVSYRKGMGVRRGSSEGEYHTLRASDPAGAIAVSPTEYRWNVLPLGGYVKMLGQEDTDPSARSDERDSYNSAPTWKRMIVISAGVVMNIITAAVLFVIVFRVGLLTEAPVLGRVVPGSPAAFASVKVGPAGTLAGLRPGDEVVAVDGESVRTFNEISVASAMSSPGSDVVVEVRRAGVEGLLTFAVRPRVDTGSKMLSMGVEPERSLQLMSGKSGAQRVQAEKVFREEGLIEIQPGDRIVSVVGDSKALRTRSELDAAISARDGAPLKVVVERAGEAQANAVERRVEASVTSQPQLQQALFAPSALKRFEIDHVLGLPPVMSVKRTEDAGSKAGLRAGDVFAVLGGLQWPTFREGIDEIGKHDGRTIDVVVWRAKAGAEAAGEGAAASGTGARELVTLKGVKVTDGRIGFGVETENAPAIVGRWPSSPRVEGADGVTPGVPSGAALGLPVGSQIVSVNGEAVTTLADVWRTLRSAAKKTPVGDDVVVELVHRRVMVNADASVPDERTTWTIGGGEKGEAEALRALGWKAAISDYLLEPVQITLHASTVGEAISMGMRQTKTAMTQTYITFARLFQGSIKVEHLRGPVGIAHVGTLLADRGFIWLMFFMAIISVNLAVVNFLPLPIVDGGHFLFLLYEQFTGRPVSVAFQNVTTIAGLLLIASMFVLVTYHDVVRLVWG